MVTNYISDKAKIGENTKIWHFVYVGDDVEIGNNVKIGSLAHIDYDVKIGDNTLIEGLVYIPPLTRIACAVDMKLSDGKITSLFFISINDNAKFRAAVPLLTAIQSCDLT